MTPTAVKFSLGKLTATPGALDVMERNHENPFDYINRHVAGDWGNVPPEDAQENEFALDKRLRILSEYRLRDDTRIWIITEADRSTTTILLPAEY